MAEKVLHPLVEDELLKELEDLRKKRRISWTALVRVSSASYLRQARLGEMELVYRGGYRRIPEDTAIAEAQAAMMAEILPPESW